jgi:glyoxylase-like metal-dependent hydrolase (beta-lactamase superfamily II)
MITEEPTPPPPITPGVARALSPLVRRIANKGDDGEEPGLNTYLIGIDEIVIVDPGPGDPEHLDVVCGCGGDRIRWIIMTDTRPEYAAGALKLKELTGAELVAPAGFEGADDTLGDGYKIDATEFRVLAMAMDADAGQYMFVLEQERSLISGDLLDAGIPTDLPARVKSFRLKSIAPGHGQYIEDAKAFLGMK